MAVPTPVDGYLQRETGLAAEAQTEFAMYALPEDVAPAPAPDVDPEIMLDILSL